MRSIALSVALVASALSFAGCTSSQEGPIRPITIADDVAYTRALAEPDLTAFYGAAALKQAEVRNQIITARMYIADVEYHYYEARLTKEVQEEGLGATLTSLGLTTAATLLPAASTKAILAGAATAVTGADKAYSEKELLSNTIQALQTQMRADRKTQAAVIYAKMLRDNGKTITPIIEYTLPMALSDAETYYQAGTIASALIGLSKTLANAEQNADEAKSQAGPNPGAVSDAKGTAAPISESAAPMAGGLGGGQGGGVRGNPAGNVGSKQGSAGGQSTPDQPKKTNGEVLLGLMRSGTAEAKKAAQATLQAFLASPEVKTLLDAIPSRFFTNASNIRIEEIAIATDPVFAPVQAKIVQVARDQGLLKK
jgi:hypothetical protein